MYSQYIKMVEVHFSPKPRCLSQLKKLSQLSLSEVGLRVIGAYKSEFIDLFSENKRIEFIEHSEL